MGKLMQRIKLENLLKVYWCNIVWKRDVSPGQERSKVDYRCVNLYYFYWSLDSWGQGKKTGRLSQCWKLISIHLTICAGNAVLFIALEGQFSPSDKPSQFWHHMLWSSFLQMPKKLEKHGPRCFVIRTSSSVWCMTDTIVSGLSH